MPLSIWVDISWLVDAFFLRFLMYKFPNLASLIHGYKIITIGLKKTGQIKVW